ncbi:MAG: hypothetical protein M0R80_10660 [Proteobacteria bacterium]|nr:hypothetical protein [Pseudomonadota bacterium]
MRRRIAPAVLLAAALAATGASAGEADTARSLGLGEGFSLGAPRIIRHLDQRIEIYRPSYRGLPVFLSSCAVQLDANGAIRRISPCPAIPPVDVAAPRDSAAERHAESGWLRGRDGRLAAVVRVEAGGGPLLREPMAVFYDAQSLAEIHSEPLYESATAGGLVFGENPVTTPAPVLVELANLDEPGDLLYGLRARVERCLDTADCAATAPFASPNKEGDFIYAPELGELTFDDPFAEVNAYHNITRFADWMQDELGWTGQFGAAGHTWIAVKIGKAWYNAAYYGGNSSNDPYIIFGQDVVDMAYDADVACHEFGHAINRSLRGHAWFLRDAYGLDTSPTGIEEGFADIWTQTFNGDPVMNAYITKSRTADNDLVCPDALAGEGHYEARIISGFGWDVRERIGGEAWSHVVFRTLPFLPAEAGFAELVAALAASAADLGAEGVLAIDPAAAAIIEEEGAARGLLDEACAKRLVPLEGGVRRGVYGYGRAKTGERDRPFGVQWVLTAPDDAAAFHLDVEWLYPEDVAPGYRIHVSRGKPVAVTWLDPDAVPEGDPEFEVDADLTLEGAPSALGFPAVGEPALAPGEKVYLLFSADTDESTVVLAGTPMFLSEQPSPQGDAGPVPESELAARAAPFGIGCAAAPRHGRTASLLAALLP